MDVADSRSQVLGMKERLSPRELAEAIGVSESSVKRWSDQGLIPVERTAGGHRRLPIGGVIQFVRNSDMTLVRPELLGLPVTAAPEATDEDLHAAVVTALADGHEERFRAAVFRLYVEGMRAAEICDRHLAAAFHELGDRWAHGRLEVYEERRGVEVCRNVLYELSQAVPEPPAGAPRAVGGTLEGDWYSLPTAMVAIALKEAGWEARSFGSSHPLETLLAALEDQAPRLFWLSVSWVGDRGAVVEAVNRLHRAAVERGTALVVGGRALDDELKRRMRCSAFCDDLVQVQSLAAALAPGRAGIGGEMSDDDVRSSSDAG